MKKQEPKTRTDFIYLLVDHLIDFYIIDIFKTENKKEQEYCDLIIKHEADELFGIQDLSDIELLFIKKQVVGLYVC